MGKKKWLLALVEVNESLRILDGVAPSQVLSGIPDELDEAIYRMSPSGALELDRVYLLEGAIEDTVVPFIEAQAVDYQGMTEAYEAACQSGQQPTHAHGRVVQLSDWTKKDTGQPN